MSTPACKQHARTRLGFARFGYLVTPHELCESHNRPAPSKPDLIPHIDQSWPLPTFEGWKPLRRLS
ncbi:hypothetical protein CORC01_11337 [Colletotrichum orchidophilum]|uniref:Uncharacterized protein n=1 Tax=Colletotrichum orchidophilum TaxID=1209926 RepID=A0A1G4AW75_9PEZI|nr:uncharacterized protein CORC01_11337 [Colletotrichum orchidophilum]OHE93387.1 hypothetical protein CORC01_11337 [Colletotrichum orchidophilum]